MTPVKQTYSLPVYVPVDEMWVLEWMIMGAEGIKDEVKLIESEMKRKLCESQKTVTSDHCGVH